MTPKRNYSQDRFRIFNAIADSVAESSDEEFLSELKESGEDAQQVAGHVREVIQWAVKRFDEQSVKDKAVGYAETPSEAKRKIDWNMPIQELRDFLGQFLNQMPQYGGLVTVQCRDFKELPDAEVRSIVKQLQELGVLDKLQ
jgi:uncharacterized damage-inducible protein DinB